MDNVTPIRSDIAISAQPKRKRCESRGSGAKVKAIENRAAEIRDLVFEAQSIIEVSRAAIGSDTPPADEWWSRKALEIASRLLNTVAGALEPGAITQTGVFHAEQH